MNGKSKFLFFALLGLLIGMFLVNLLNKKNEPAAVSVETYNKKPVQQSIDQLTNENTVIQFVKKNYRLPDYYVTKNEAREYDWNPSKGNLCEVLPGKAIGGDIFNNREGRLPKGKTYFEADVNYSCGNRNANRIIFTKKGEVYLTRNHYKTFIKK